MVDVVVSLKKDAGQSLGVGFKKVSRPPHCQVSILVENGVAAQSGLVQKGDLLLSVNGINVQHLSPNEVVGVLARHSTDSTIMLELRREMQNGNMNDINNELNSHPTIQIDRSESPTDIHPGSESSPSPPSNSPTRPRRRNNNVGSLPEIEEDSPEKNNFLVSNPTVTQRHSITPEPIRKSLEELRRAALRSSKSLDLGNLPQWRTGSSAKSVPIHNLLDGSEMTDRLHTKSIKEYKETGCSEERCLGSHMQLKPKRPYGTVRPKEEVLPLAEDFIKQYYESKKIALGHEYENKLAVRLWQVQQELEEKGIYQLTYEELVFGARTAWRNAPRCVNRIVWRQLEVLDARDASTPKDMFEAICHHIKYANNGGNLRSTITIFPNRIKPHSDFRVWNSQLVGYAGYKSSDGTILGDPANAEFTEICINNLGWTPPKNRSEFDVLPLVLQANGGEPEFFEIPPEIVLMCDIVHPEYDWFKDLGLQWYALPAVANMLLDCGGLEFPGIPFNGWYMGTEIARDLGDANRYNKLKVIAQKMGLNTQTYKLWKDRAVVELNVAILHSFQKANFSIVDHHSTTESFITHMKSETQTRGGCPADWVWIVPPVSGSVTPVFHQEMLLYNLSPSYEYQYPPWKFHRFAGMRERAGSFQGPHRFKKLANMIKLQNRMYRNVYQKRIKATILFATETGRSRNYANVVKDIFGRVFAAKVCCMEDYDKSNLEHEQLVIIVTSTFGSGDPPSNGELFGRYLLDMRNNNGVIITGNTPTPTRPRSHRMSTVVAPTSAMLDSSKKSMDKPLTQVKYAVFGLGSRAYPNFCTFAHTCDNLLQDLGASRIMLCGEGDELCGQEESFQAWLQQCYLSACEEYSIDPEKTDSDLEGYKAGYCKEDYRIQSYVKPLKKKDLCANLKTVHSKNISPFILKSRSKLQAPHSDRSTILVVLESANRIPYEPGDHIAIYPQNSPKLVNEVIECLNPAVNPDEPIFVESRRHSHTQREHWVEERRMPVPITIREALTYYLDITNPSSPQFLKLLAKQATRTIEQDELNELGKGGTTYEDWKYEKFPNLVDVLNQFHSLKIDVTLLLQQLPLLQCRYYSISSSPRKHPNQVHATVAIVSFKKRNGQGPVHNGVCSTWLNRLEMGSMVPCVVRQAHAFHMPDDPRVPVIMVGPGTGIAPYRSFWQDRMFMINEELKTSLNQPSLTLPSQQQTKTLNLNKPSPGSRRRRKTHFEAPKLSMLQAPEQCNVPTNNSSGWPMRRSMSDTNKSEELAKVLATKQKSRGCMSLYFGCRRSDMDHIYKDELTGAKISGALTDLHVAFSREPGKPKTYVQHLLKENADKIVRQLMEDGGHFYVCGDISMAADVCRTLQNIFEENAAMSAEEARCLIESMKDRGFYHEDIFGVTLKHQEVTTRVRSAAKKQNKWRYLVTSGDTISHPLHSPMTPNARMPSPLPGSRPPMFDASSEYSSSTLPSSRSPRTHPKRPTVTVLLPSATTPPEGKPKQLYDQKTESNRGKTSLQSAPIQENKAYSQGGSMKLLTIEEPPKIILDPVIETDSPLEKSPNALSPTNEVPSSDAQVNNVSVNVPTIDIQSPTVDDARLPETPPTSPPTTESQPPVLKRNMSEEKKVKRIRTNSRVETAI